MPRLEAKCCAMMALQVHSNEEKMMRFAPGCLLLESRFAAKCCAMSALQVHTNKDMMQFAPGYFSGLYFWGVSLGSPLAESQKMSDWGVLAKFAIARLYGLFGSRGLQRNVVLCLLFKRILIRRGWHFAPGSFCGLLLGGVSLCRNFAESQRVRDEGVLAKFAIARLYGDVGSRDLQQNVVLCFHFKFILISRWWHLRQGVFVAYCLDNFPLVDTLQNLRKCAWRVSLPNSP